MAPDGQHAESRSSESAPRERTSAEQGEGEKDLGPTTFTTPG